MSVDASNLHGIRTRAKVATMRWTREETERLSTALFTSLNIAVFLVLAGSVVGAAFLYSQGA